MKYLKYIHILVLILEIGLSAYVLAKPDIPPLIVINSIYAPTIIQRPLERPSAPEIEAPWKVRREKSSKA